MCEPVEKLAPPAATASQSLKMKEVPEMTGAGELFFIVVSLENVLTLVIAIGWHRLANIKARGDQKTR